ncbi:MAG TPA: HYR domain-containing protein [Blastocatellia bacterium]|nr:HYR domain-containing protein [Blastocatellia bacterium]
MSRTKIKKSLYLLIALIAIGLLTFQSDIFRNAKAQAGPPTFVVNDTGDAPDANLEDGVCLTAGGVCTLRAAMEQANTHDGGGVEIEFNIAGPGPHTITPATPLPTISSPMLIDGTSEPDFTDIPVIEIDGSATTGNGFNIITGDSDIRGLAINGFPGHGVFMTEGGFNTILGNFIGTNVAGTAGDGNSGDGIHIQNSPSNSIFNNVISDNLGAGISINGSSSNSTQIRGNLIGTNRDASAALGNTGDGIFINDAPSTNVGEVGLGNVISANNIGVEIQGESATGTFVVSNLIGTDKTGTMDLGNESFGVAITGSSNNQIGGTFGPDLRLADRVTVNAVSDGGNIIAFNGDDGVAVLSGVSNLISNNSIFSNDGLGIDLSPTGVTPNDPGDGDTGPNNLQNFPVLTSATSNNEGTTINGSISGSPSNSYVIEFFSNDACDPSGFGEGQNFLGAVAINSSTTGGATFSASFPQTVFGNQFVTATATAIGENTSEFSNCLAVDGPLPVADVGITKSGEPESVSSGSDLTYTITITNNGPQTATGVMWTDQIPAGTTFVSLISPGASCTTPPAGGTGQVQCQIGTLAANQMVTATLVVNVTAPPGSTITNTAAVTSTSSDDNSENDQDTETTEVAPAVCPLTCPEDITEELTGGRCGTNIMFPNATGEGEQCGTITCVPPSGTFFPAGVTLVTCSSQTGDNCSFTVTVVDLSPPVINCPGNMVVRAAQGQTSVPVNFGSPTSTENCGDALVTCQPPSGSQFPLGVTVVECTATDSSGNTDTCTFTVTVDNTAPSIICPPNITATSEINQCAANVFYPLPTVMDNQAGVQVVCAPPSGSSFPVGVTTVNCTATDRAGNTSTCSFTVTVGSGSTTQPIVSSASQLVFGPGEPVRKPGKSKPSNCSDCVRTFTITNTGCAQFTVSLAQLDFTSSPFFGAGQLSDLEASNFFMVFLVNANGSERQLDFNDSFVIGPGQSVTIRVIFKPVIPGFTGNDDDPPASQVLPEEFTARLLFASTGGSVAVDLIGRTNDELRLINPVNPRKAKRVLFTRSGDEFRITYAVYDPDLNFNSVQFQFFDASGRQVDQTFVVDMSAVIQNSGLLPGQSATIVQRFAGALGHPEIASVRVTVSDPESSDSATGQLQGSSDAGLTVQSMRDRQRYTVIAPRRQLGAK